MGWIIAAVVAYLLVKHQQGAVTGSTPSTAPPSIAPVARQNSTSANILFNPFVGTLAPAGMVPVITSAPASAPAPSTPGSTNAPLGSNQLATYGSIRNPY